MTSPSDRLALIADTAIEVLAERGMRGLTHRAVDAAADLPTGSTSYYARTREALLQVVLDRMVHYDLAANPPARASLDPADLDAVSRVVGDQLYARLTGGASRERARFEFALEATRRPELRTVYDAAGAQVRRPALALLRAAGSREPERHARLLIAWSEGVLFDSLVGAGRDRPPTRAELRSGARDVLRGMLGR